MSRGAYIYKRKKSKVIKIEKAITEMKNDLYNSKILGAFITFHEEYNAKNAIKLSIE